MWFTARFVNTDSPQKQFSVFSFQLLIETAQLKTANCFCGESLGNQIFRILPR
jgi:hypothetical protein